MGRNLDDSNMVGIHNFLGLSILLPMIGHFVFLVFSLIMKSTRLLHLKGLRVGRGLVDNNVHFLLIVELQHINVP